MFHINFGHYYKNTRDSRLFARFMQRSVHIIGTGS